MAEPKIKMPFALTTRVVPRNHVLDVALDLMRKGNFLGKGRPYGHSAVNCAKTAKPIEMPFGLWGSMCPRNHHVLDGVHIPMGRGNFGEKEKGCPL